MIVTPFSTLHRQADARRRQIQTSDVVSKGNSANTNQADKGNTSALGSAPLLDDNANQGQDDVFSFEKIATSVFADIAAEKAAPFRSNFKKSLKDQKGTDVAKQSIAEEAGDYLGSQLNNSDTNGDESELFGHTLNGEALTADQLLMEVLLMEVLLMVKRLKLSFWV